MEDNDYSESDFTGSYVHYDNDGNRTGSSYEGPDLDDPEMEDEEDMD
ncbi:MAG: hypothetical protein HUJ69_02795 [Lachnospiraceae bacterium]|nr:hypothetical protein [Lachnospiraceae bacterium]